MVSYYLICEKKRLFGKVVLQLIESHEENYGAEEYNISINIINTLIGFLSI